MFRTILVVRHQEHGIIYSITQYNRHNRAVSTIVPNIERGIWLKRELIILVRSISRILIRFIRYVNSQQIVTVRPSLMFVCFHIGTLGKRCPTLGVKNSFL